MTTSAALLGAAFALSFTAEGACAATLSLARRSWSLELAAPGVHALRCLAAWIVPPLMGALAGALFAGVAQAGWAPHWALVAPDFSRLSPSAGVRKLFSAQRLAASGRGCLFLVGGAGLLAVPAYEALGLLARMTGASPLQAAAGAGCLLAEGASRLGGALGLFALFEFALAWRRTRKELQMSRDEVRREHRESEGDPMLKGQRRALHRALAQGGPARGVASANAVVVNPTHIAVALRYAPGETEAPYVVARGREEEALRLRAEAQSLGIPVVRDVPLARALVEIELGEELPEELYRAAAAILKLAAEFPNSGGRSQA